MQAVEPQRHDRCPYSLAGHGAGLDRASLRGFRCCSWLGRIGGDIARRAGLRDFDVLDAAVAHSRLAHRIDAAESMPSRRCRRVDAADHGAIPAEVRRRIVIDHPAAARNAPTLLHAFGPVRRDVNIVANDSLMRLEPMSGLLLPVRVRDIVPAA